MLDVVCKILLFCKVYIRVIFVKNTSKINTTNGDERKKKKRDGIKTCARDFESMEHDVTISNGKQYNNFSYSFYFLLL